MITKMNKMLYGLSYGSVTNLVYIIIHNNSTSKTSYINSDGNSVLQGQYNAQVTAHTTLD